MEKQLSKDLDDVYLDPAKRFSYVQSYLRKRRSRVFYGASKYNDHECLS